MSRQFSPESDDYMISTEQLLAYLDNDVAPEVIERIEMSPQCLEEVRKLARLHNRITQRLYRVLCPSAQELSEYHLGLTPNDQSKTIKQHLQECVHCASELETLQEYLDDLQAEFFPKPKPLGKQILNNGRVIVAELMDRLSSPEPLPAFALLGDDDEDGGPLIYQAGDIQVSIQVEEDEELPNHFALIGSIIGIEPDGLVVRIWSNEEPEEVTRVDVDVVDTFEIPRLKAAVYELVLEKTETKIHISDLRI
ncbi:hypothetical protein KFU94_45150 [Chloroflexi bacterium TSY]|nr:hypothetical protein [Chloroflexi bacterium TSY]